MDEKDEREETPQRGRLDLSVPQVAGSALAAVTAALLASQLGVYGTIIGAGVVSVVATAGGTLFQHFFRRTGEQIRTVSTRHLPVSVPGTDPGPQAGSTRMLEELPPPGESGGPEDGRPDGEYGEATVHGTTKRGWRKSAIGAVVVFVLAMGTVTSIELATGSEPSVTAVFNGGSHGGSPAGKPSAPASDPAGSPSGAPSSGPSTTPSGSSSPSPTPSDSGSGSPTPDPSGSPSTSAPSGTPSTGTSSTPAPGPSSDAGTGGTGGSASPGTQD
ncbi:hypothetical protein [Streptomyces sp. H39-S7]|uniref:hypothetical protein n=1 Tax=Streptomyces sp. H39-S7 TaxID=3004357 RepID=UPI0022AFDA9F|nr:hypothetical protein [Streptomyces sp. H39-S7]